MNILSPSILAADFAKLGEQVSVASDAGAEYIHVDIMDGHFVPNLSMGSIVVEAIRPVTEKVLDVHLMVENPEDYIDQFARAGADSITVHAEATDEDGLEALLKAIKSKGLKTGVSINPETAVERIPRRLLKDIDMILIMSVHPGFGGQSFIEDTYNKIRDMRAILNEMGLSSNIEVDGGINLQNVEKVIEAGANVIVAGTSVFSGDIEKNVKNFMQKM